MKIVFVNFGRENLGIEYLSAVLKREGHAVDLVHDPGIFSREDNVFYNPSLERIFRKRGVAEEIIKKTPDIVAFSVYTTTYQWACEVAREIKRQAALPIVFGGAHPTLVPENVISRPFIDYVHIGEGEKTFLDLIRAISGGDSLEEVNNLYYKKDGKVFNNPLLNLPVDLDALPIPDKELFAKYIRYRDDYMILTSRGCPFSCSYCCESHTNQIYNRRYFRRRSVGSVINELSQMKERYGFKEVMFFDSIFFTDKKWLKEFLVRYRQIISVPFRCLGHIGFFDHEVGMLLKNSGCYCINFGIQTFNQSIRRDVLNRTEENSQMKNVFDICDDLRLRYDVDLMFGLPGAQGEDYELPLDFMKRSKFLNRLKCYNISFFPRLPIVEKAKEAGILDAKDIEGIEEGITGDFFHLDSLKSASNRRYKEDFQKLYKIYPAIPGFLRTAIINHRLHRFFHLIPGFLVVFIQLIIGISKKDLRFSIYMKNYYHQLKNMQLNFWPKVNKDDV